MGSDNGNINKPTLILNEFKELYREVGKFLPSWCRFLFLGFLVWVEKKVIEQRVTHAVDEAIKEYETLHSPPEIVIPPPVYSESGSNFFDEMRLTAPWVPQEDPSDPP